MISVDLNCDIGESYGVYELGEDALLVPHVTSVSVACGWHAGDPRVMRESIDLALSSGAAIGAHPGLPDRMGFGRRAMEVSPQEAYDLVMYQVGALSAFAAAAGTRLQHVKPHGALYNTAAIRTPIAAAIARAVKAVDSGLVLFALAGSRLALAGESEGLKVAREAFPDRSYLRDGTLVPRSRDGALVGDIPALVSRAVRLVQERTLRSADGVDLHLEADTLCIHGDTPGAATLALELRSALVAHGVRIRAVGRSVGPPLAGDPTKL